MSTTTTIRAALRDLDPAYKLWYNRGWASRAQSLDYADGRGYPDAWYDGYADQGTGREKWHTALCVGCVHPIAGPHGRVHNEPTPA